MMIPSRQRSSRVRAAALPPFWLGRPRAVLLLAVAVWLLLWTARPALAQVDPLLPVKGLPPNVIVVLDTSFPMLKDAAGDYYDLKTYNRTDDITVATALGVSATQYRRKYSQLQFEALQNANSKYYATDIVATPSTATNYATFWAPTRFEMARSGIAQAVTENPNLVRWGLLKLRQNAEAWRNTASTSGCDRPVRVTGNAVLAAITDIFPCSGGATNMFVMYAPSTAGPNFGESMSPGDAVVYAVGSANVTTNIQTALTQTLGTGALIPAGQDQAGFADRPIYNALVDAKAHASAAMATDSTLVRSFRNTVIVLVTSGKDDGNSTYMTHGAMSTLASSFATVSSGSGSRRVPIVVVGVSPAAADEAELQGIASASGGAYFRATSALEVTRAVNYAVQMGFSHANDVENRRSSEYAFVSPIVGTVNLIGARTATGVLLPDTDILSVAGPTSGLPLPQRSNVMLTAGFGLPGFDGRLRAFRTFKPVADSTKPTGWKFVQDGTRLWPDLDDRPELAGLARVPSSPDARNIYTFLPTGPGTGTMVAFTVANSGTLAAHLGGADPATLIPFVRGQPLGAIVGSTPAIMDPPSLDPPPDDEYGFADSVGTFAGNHKNRRSIIFFGANDGMIHAVDARTGYEVWAFIPYNLLPKLQTLMDGQSVERFDYFVDSSPKLAEVKLGGVWKTLLVIGQGYGGTFYQAFNVSEAGMGVAPDADGSSAVASMLSRFDTPGESIDFEWAFPSYGSFDPNIRYTNATLGDTFPGGSVTFFGDLKSSASNVEKRVGFTFSDPAVGTLTSDRSITGVMTGSGYFPEVEDNLAGRGTSAPRAGRSFFLLDAATGLPVGNPGGGACSGTGCFDVGDASNGRKNAIQADVTASGDFGATSVTKAYVGDADGRYWRFTFNAAGAITGTSLVDTGQPIFSSSALLFIGTTDRYLFFGTGSDVLANTAPGGSGTFKLLGIKDGGATVFSKTLTPVSSLTTACALNGERPSSSPTVAGDIVFFTTSTGYMTQPCIDGVSKIYAFTYLGTAAYDTNNNHTMDTNESPVVATGVGRGSAPFIVDQHLFIGTTSSLGTGITALGDAEDFNNGVGQVGVRILSWREIR